MNVLNLIKDSLKKERVIIGYNKSVKALKSNKVEKIIISSNAPEKIVEHVKHLCSVNGKELLSFDGTNLELGAVCRKPFGIMVLGIKE